MSKKRRRRQSKAAAVEPKELEYFTRTSVKAFFCVQLRPLQPFAHCRDRDCGRDHGAAFIYSGCLSVPLSTERFLVCFGGSVLRAHPNSEKSSKRADDVRELWMEAECACAVDEFAAAPAAAAATTATAPAAAAAAAAAATAEAKTRTEFSLFYVLNR